MAKKKYVIKVPCTYTDREGNEKTYYRTIGSASIMKNGGLFCNFEAYPANGKAMIVEKEPYDPNRRGGGGRSKNGYNRSQNEYSNGPDDDDVPF